MNGFICGGVISQSQHDKNVAEYGVWADTMSYVMPDEKYAEYIALKKINQKWSDKGASEIFKKYAVSQI